MPTGTVKWFNNAKGYGFILPEEGGEDLFAHYSAIQMDGYKTLKAGQVVDFDVTKGEKGFHATNIKSLEASQSTLTESPTEQSTSTSQASAEQSSEELAASNS